MRVYRMNTVTTIFGIALSTALTCFTSSAQAELSCSMEIDRPSLALANPYLTTLGITSRISTDGKTASIVKLVRTQIGAGESHFAPNVGIIDLTGNQNTQFTPMPVISKPYTEAELAAARLPYTRQNAEHLFEVGTAEVTVQQAVVTPDGQRAFGFHADLHRSIVSMDLSAKVETPRIQTDGVRDLAVSNTRMVIIGKHEVSIVSIFAPDYGTEIFRIKTDGTAGSYLPGREQKPARLLRDGVAAAFTDDFKKVVMSIHENGKTNILVVDAASGAVLKTFSDAGGLLAVSAKGNIALVKNREGRLGALSLTTGKVAEVSARDGVMVAAISPNGKYIAAQYTLGKVTVIADGKSIDLDVEGDQVSDLRFSSDSKRLSAIGEHLFVWNMP
ncbi:MAG TPA: hypothetical protein VM432_10250 [Bdellovibrionales bacterium]|nr:hypothetical protein [Bdellovibrionales bacterium]